MYCGTSRLSCYFCVFRPRVTHDLEYRVLVHCWLHWRTSFAGVADYDVAMGAVRPATHVSS